MAPPAPQGSSLPNKLQGRRRSLGKVLSKVRTALRGRDGAGRGQPPPPPSSSSAAAAAAAAAAAKLTSPAPTPRDPPSARVTSTETPAMSTLVFARAHYEGIEGVTRLARSQLLEERARKLGERYGLDLQPSDWQLTKTSADDTVFRVDKSVRVRVRRTCHQCNHHFLAARECPHCQHVRCNLCTRYPPRRTEAEKLASRERREAAVKARRANPPILADFANTDVPVVLKRPSRTGGKDLVYRKARRRVRRYCHECQALFLVGDKKCPGCSHVRCTDCPRDPPKKEKYPFGYPGDVFGPNSVPRFECERCKTLYPADTEHGSACGKCGCEKSDASPRARPRKVELEPNPAALKALQAKLDSLKMT